ncbi:MAG: hypothetical protein IJU70_05745 [Lentisphaeria bacterium]|nr:hypothetical protein [Lentisphaeria bacterium]
MKNPQDRIGETAGPYAKKKPFLQSFTAAAVLLIACLVGAKACAEGRPGFLAILFPLVLFLFFFIRRPDLIGGFLRRGIGRTVLILLTVFVIAASVISLIGIAAKHDVAADVEKHLRSANGNAPLRCRRTGRKTKGRTVLLQIDLPAGQNWDIGALSEVSVPCSVVVNGGIKAMPDLEKSPVEDLALYSAGQEWAHGGGDLTKFRRLKSLTIGKIGMEEFRKLRLPPGLKFLSLDFKGDAELDLACLSNLEDLEDLCIGSFDGSLKLKIPDAGLPRLSTLVLSGNCTGYGKLVKTTRLKRLVFQNMKVPAALLTAPEYAKIKTVIFRETTVVPDAKTAPR